MANLLTGVPFIALQFYFFEMFKHLFKCNNEETFSIRMISGAGAGVVAGFITYPFDLVRTIISTNKGLKQESIPMAISRIFKSEGLYGFFKGLGPSTLGVMLWTSLNMSIFDTLKKSHITLVNDKGVNFFLLGAFSGCFSMVCVYPIDLIR